MTAAIWSEYDLFSWRGLAQHWVLQPVDARSRPCVVRHRVGAQKVGQRLAVAAARCNEPAKRRAAARSEAETAICRPQLAVFRDTEGGPRANCKPGSVRSNSVFGCE